MICNLGDPMSLRHPVACLSCICALVHHIVRVCTCACVCVLVCVCTRVCVCKKKTARERDCVWKGAICKQGNVAKEKCRCIEPTSRRHCIMAFLLAFLENVHQTYEIVGAQKKVPTSASRAGMNACVCALCSSVSPPHTHARTHALSRCVLLTCICCVAEMLQNCFCRLYGLCSVMCRIVCADVRVYICICL